MQFGLGVTPSTSHDIVLICKMGDNASPFLKIAQLFSSPVMSSGQICTECFSAVGVPCALAFGAHSCQS